MTSRTVCRGCRRPLRAAASVALGYGRKCATELGILQPRQPRAPHRADDRQAEQHHPGQTAIPIQMEIPT
ncbi:DUF6011 domain-containing protein [Yinghuangia soli]|uniref:DUF6011 domain-containing protein n=1 Tax=Yinghuangia soli TaxID=2908204 RepID=A0AA41Q679_9ACTN|nr:DUF6011 domain-containing protein [Yinghuangia soli]MCF2531725.1 DUF6011 domain-containing protein [Yinghuangia soli]